MADLKVLLFVSSNCPHCPKAEHVARKIIPEYEDYGIVLRKMRTKSPEGKELAERYGIRGTPTIVIVDSDGNEKKRIVGVPSEDTLRKDIEKILGLRKSFFGKLFGG